MKHLRLLSLLVAAAVSVTLFSACQKEDTSPFGITEMSLTMPNGRTVKCTVNQDALTIDNGNDPVETGLPAPMYIMKVNYKATLETTVTYNGAPLQSGVTEIDFSSPVVLEAKKPGKKTDRKINYTVTVKSDANDKSETEGKKLNEDMTKAGFPACSYADVAVFKDEFYAITAEFPSGTATTDPAYYRVYKSMDGISWTKVETNLKVIGGMGARLMVFKDKLWSFGGGRYYGTDEDGNASSAGWFGPTDYNIPEFFVYSTPDGRNWTKETIEIEGNQSSFGGCILPRIASTGSTLVFTGGLVSAFGMLQGGASVVTSSDGIKWTVNEDAMKAENAVEAIKFKVNSCLYYFKGKVFNAGGFANYVSKNFLKGNVYSSTDNGATWKLEIEDGGFGKMFGMRVVGTEDVLYMVGGQTYGGEGGETPVLSNKVFRSTDGVNWTELSGEIAMSSTFAGRVYAPVAAYGDMMWVFGGRELTSGNYGAAEPVDKLIFDTWKKRIK